MDQEEEKQKHPITGEPFDEAEERAKLTPIDRIASTSKEMQQEFQRYVEQRLIPDIAYRDFEHRSNASKFFFAREVSPSSEGPNTRRAYFKMDKSGKFRSAYELTFVKSPNISDLVTSFTIHLLGEEFNAPYEELDSLTINCDLSIARDETMDIQSKIHSRVLRAKYWLGGKLDVVEFNTDLRQHHSNDIALTNEIFEDVKSKKSKKIIQSRGSEFEVIYNEESDSIEIRRVLDSKQTDFISIPMETDFQQLQRRVLSGQLIDNPVQANLDEDDEWKSINLGNLGIIWQRS